MKWLKHRGLSQTAAMLAFSVCLTSAAQPATARSIGPEAITLETAAIRPTPPSTTNWRMEFFHGRIRIENRSVRDLIEVAYGLSAHNQVTNAPPWVDSEHFDINGTFDGGGSNLVDEGTPEQRNSAVVMLMRSLLAQRFALHAHEGKIVLPVWAMTVAAKPGKSIQPAQQHSGSTFHGIVGTKGNLQARGVSMAALAERLTSITQADGRQVVNETGLPGPYDWTLHWNQESLSAASGETDEPSLFTALQEQLGLKLVARKSAVTVDAVEHPSPN